MTTIERGSTDKFFDEIRPIQDYSFDSSPPIQADDDVATAWWQLARQHTESFVVRDGGQVAAVACNLPMTQQVRGQIVPAWGVWGVATHPSARRNGNARRAVLALLEAGYEAGMPISLLYPFRESFYERLGYVTFPQPRNLKFEVRNARPALKLALDGQVEMVSFKEGFEQWRAYSRQMQPEIHGFVVTDHGWPECFSAYKDRLWLAIARIDGEVVGMMPYRIHEENNIRDLHARRFHYTDVRGRYLLLQWIARHIDQVRDARLQVPPCEQPETWLSDLQVKYQDGWAPMARILNVRRIGGAQVGVGAFTARIHDEHCPWNAGVFRFEAVDGALAVTEAGKADFNLDIRGLAALLYGTHDPVDFAIRAWGDPTPAQQTVLRTMFPPQIPYMHEAF